jgi:hypothetical protein
VAVGWFTLASLITFVSVNREALEKAIYIQNQAIDLKAMDRRRG